MSFFLMCDLFVVWSFLVFVVVIVCLLCGVFWVVNLELFILRYVCFGAVFCLCCFSSFA